MTTARKHQVRPDVTPYYHCTSRCVRRSFLCGVDEVSGQSFEHRRGWIEERLWALSSVFCIDICAYAIMSNHYHLVLHLNTTKAQNLSDKEVITRWKKLHTIPPSLLLILKKDTLDEGEKALLSKHLTTWRQRLSSLSWFMREMNMGIAQLANKEDRCTGHFWEGRYKSQALLDETALISAMAYADLNPVRAQIANTPEQSEYTSIKLRCWASTHHTYQPKQLAPLSVHPLKGEHFTIPFNLKDYFNFVDWVGRIVRDDKPGAIAKNTPNILSRLQWPVESYSSAYQCFGKKGVHWVGCKESVDRAQSILKRKRMKALRL
ncbi:MULTISPECIES: transposase [unclassified Vibrio]|uniref:Transposase n=1 Tax=Vibrio sp. HB236076 TaxID=3232307 RepID=A0AB39HEM9_9VIBR|nr:transposase [Vibrio sp. HB161653]MDP5254363.1 transposase [Vibrio sp. HB161653]